MSRTLKYKLEDFIGKKYGNYEVLSAERSGAGNRMKIDFQVKCHECAKDPELFGDAVFTIQKGNLERGGLCCGCAKHVRWSSKQQEVRVKRRCRELNFEFCGFVGEYAGWTTKLKLKCLTDGNEWSATTVSGFFFGSGGCEACKNNASSLRTKIPDEVAIESFKATGKFLEGTVFTRREEYNKGANFVWEVYCPKCSNDEYVKAGVCDGIFTSQRGDLAKGKVPCRCSERYRYTANGLQFKVESIILDNDLPYSFVKFVEGDFRGTRGKMTLNCKVHGNWDISITSFLTNTVDTCPSCAKYGFNQKLPATLYVLSVEGSRPFTGYGITNYYENRRKRHTANLRNNGFYIDDERVFNFEIGSDARLAEVSLSKQFPVVSQGISGFIKEATHYHLYDEVVAQVESMIQSQHTLH